jgi:hypothetical protein
MLPRATLLALLAAPALASAQTAGTITFDPATYVNLDACTGGTDVTLDWTVLLESGATFSTSWTYRVYSSSSAPSGETGAPKYCADGAVQVGSDIDATNIRQSETVIATDLATAAGFTCGTATEPTLYVCVHLYDDASTRQGSATGSLKLQLLAPDVPGAPAVTPGNTRLYASWSAVTSSPAATQYRVQASTGGTVASTATTTGTSATLGGLSNGVTYQVEVRSVSAGGNVSGPSPATDGTPVASDDFWEHYVSAGGQEEGGCTTGGGAGLLALLGALALRAAGRRRP